MCYEYIDGLDILHLDIPYMRCLCPVHTVYTCVCMCVCAHIYVYLCVAVRIHCARATQFARLRILCVCDPRSGGARIGLACLVYVCCIDCWCYACYVCMWCMVCMYLFA